MWKKAGFQAEGYADIRPALWEKFLCNVTMSGACGILQSNVGEMMDNPAAWRVAVECAKEAYRVARAQGISFSDASRLASEEDVEGHVRLFGETVRNAKPSLLHDLEAGRKSEVDAINGAVPIEARKVGLSAPVNETVADLLRAKEFWASRD